DNVTRSGGDIDSFRGIGQIQQSFFPIAQPEPSRTVAGDTGSDRPSPGLVFAGRVDAHPAGRAAKQVGCGNRPSVKGSSQTQTGSRQFKSSVLHTHQGCAKYNGHDYDWNKSQRQQKQ